MIDVNKLSQKAHHLISRGYTRMARRLFGHFGAESILFYPSRINNPKSIFVGRAVVLESSIWLNAVDEWQGKSHGGKISIGDHSVVCFGAQISALESITIGRHVGIARFTVIVDHHHDYTLVDLPILKAPLTKPSPVVIEDEVFIGVHCLIAPGVTIGRHSFIAANSVVTHNIPPYSFAAGAPARVLRVYNHDTGVWEKSPWEQA